MLYCVILCFKYSELSADENANAELRVIGKRVRKSWGRKRKVRLQHARAALRKKQSEKEFDTSHMLEDDEDVDGSAVYNDVIRGMIASCTNCV